MCLKQITNHYYIMSFANSKISDQEKKLARAAKLCWGEKMNKTFLQILSSVFKLRDTKINQTIKLDSPENTKHKKRKQHN